MNFNLKFILAAVLLPLCFSCNNNKNSNGLPEPDHIVIVIEENHGFDQIIGSPHAPFINQLASQGALFTNSHGVTHPSQPNYIALFSGSVQGVKGDECLKDSTPYTTPNLGAALIDKGYTFGGYAQTLPYDSFMECYYKKSPLNGGALYARKHCPWVNWLGNKENNMPYTVSHPMNEFPSDFSKLPTVAFVIPDQDHDMHNNGGDTAMVRMADDWIKENLTKYINWAKDHNSLFILTYDEDNFTPQNEIPTIFLGSMVEPGKYADSINHYSVLRTIEGMYGLAKSGPAQASVITKVWK